MVEKFQHLIGFKYNIQELNSAMAQEGYYTCDIGRAIIGEIVYQDTIGDEVTVKVKYLGGVDIPTLLDEVEIIDICWYI